MTLDPYRWVIFNGHSCSDLSSYRRPHSFRLSLAPIGALG